MPLYIVQSGDLDRCYASLTDGQTLKDRATQLPTKYKSGALVTQYAAEMTLQRADTRQGYYSATNPSWQLGSPDHLTRLELSRFRSLPFLMISFDGSKPQNWSVTIL